MNIILRGVDDAGESWMLVKMTTREWNEHFSNHESPDIDTWRRMIFDGVGGLGLSERTKNALLRSTWPYRRGKSEPIVEHLSFYGWGDGERLYTFDEWVAAVWRKENLDGIQAIRMFGDTSMAELKNVVNDLVSGKIDS